MWFRRDLRLADNPALDAALRSGRPVLPVFVWPSEGEWAPGPAARWWLRRSLAALDADLRARGSRLVVLEGPAPVGVDRTRPIDAGGGDRVGWCTRAAGGRGGRSGAGGVPRGRSDGRGGRRRPALPARARAYARGRSLPCVHAVLACLPRPARTRDCPKALRRRSSPGRTCGPRAWTSRRGRRMGRGPTPAIEWRPTGNRERRARRRAWPPSSTEGWEATPWSGIAPTTTAPRVSRLT